MNKIETKYLYFLGPEGTYAQTAMKKFQKDLNISAEQILPLTPITRILQTIDENKDAMAVVPIENSIEGIVRETIDNLVRIKDKDIKIISETIIPISHCLMSKAENLSEIRHIISHPQALGQCSGYICKNLKDVDVIETTSTSEAAKIAKEKGGEYAAIASEAAAEIYNLKVFDRNINDENDNKTRFIFLSRENAKDSQNSKTSVFFTVKNEPGSLVKVLNIFHKYNINLIYIESRPSKKKLGEYNFFVDLEGHIRDKNVASALNLAERITKQLAVFGSYPKFNG
ncbi:MAG: prephenate dehydratase [Candidatus Gastranaerophilales bacterium]|nr:prephenate dehydratase [Candidatus Gastranaerophilales bacterium]